MRVQTVPEIFADVHQVKRSAIKMHKIYVSLFRERRFHATKLISVEFSELFLNISGTT